MVCLYFIKGVPKLFRSKRRDKTCLCHYSANAIPGVRVGWNYVYSAYFCNTVPLCVTVLSTNATSRVHDCSVFIVTPCMLAS
jgi:hypothetical protein